jgi:hypothetical protein
MGAAISFRLLIMKTKSSKKSRTFGEFVACVYDVCDKRDAGKVVQFAIKAHVIEFCGRRRATHA